MSRHRSILLVIALMTAISVVTSTSGVSAVGADRSIEVATADDEDAYLGFEQTAQTTNETTNLSVTIRNQFPSGTTLGTVTVTVDGETKDLTPLGSGEEGTVRFESVDCDGTVSVTASGDGVEVQLERAECS